MEMGFDDFGLYPGQQTEAASFPTSLCFVILLLLFTILSDLVLFLSTYF